MSNSEFVPKSVQLRLLSGENFPQTASKPFATQCFVTERMNHKYVNETTSRTPSANLHVLWFTLTEELSNRCDYSLRLLGLSDLSGKVFSITFRDFITFFTKYTAYLLI